MALFAGGFAGSSPSTLELSPPTWKWVECPEEQDGFVFYWYFCQYKFLQKQ
jgi:hypothetical protein